MKYLQKFNENIKIPIIGDYVVSTKQDYSPITSPITQFLKNNVGEIIDSIFSQKINYYQIKYNKIPENIKNYFIDNQLYLKKSEVRFATSKEIENYLLKNTVDKFNI